MSTTWRLHLIYNLSYGGAICLCTVISLLTVEWGGIEDLVKYISFGLTLTSLFLALIAIFHAFISNASFSQHLGRLRDASESVAISSDALSEISTSLDKRMEVLPDMLRGIESKVDQTREELARSSAERASQTSVRSDVASAEVIPGAYSISSMVHRFVDWSSYNGLLALYTAQLSHKTKIPFAMAGVWSTTNLSHDYGLAYLVAAGSAGIVQFTQKDDMINVTGIHEALPDIRPLLEAWIEARHKMQPDVWLVDPVLDRSVRPVEAYFKV